MKHFFNADRYFRKLIIGREILYLSISNLEKNFLVKTVSQFTFFVFGGHSLLKQILTDKIVLHGPAHLVVQFL